MTIRNMMSALAIGSSLALAACNSLVNQPVGNSSVPQPAKPVELNRYLGKWYEQARYEAGFQKDCEAVTAEYSRKSDGAVAVVNSCRQGGTAGPLKTAEATARVVDGSNGSKLKVTFFWPIEGDYWVLDRASDYSWSIVGEPSGRYLWILTRGQVLGPYEYAKLVRRAKALGYDTDLLRRTRQ
ncbi:lipocalin family protein [Bosea sp. MMO-172]|uniref:lipocalin family protein n=1 Tax=Bosea sp. MMO-172 TaxID=3127885 RepID=UPI003015F05B